MSERKFKIGDHVEWCHKGLFDAYYGSSNPREYDSGFVIGSLFSQHHNKELLRISKVPGGKVFSLVPEDYTRVVQEPYQVVEGVVLREGCITLINERDRKQSDQPLYKKA